MQSGCDRDEVSTVATIWLVAIMAERDRYEALNVALGDRLNAMQIRLQHLEHTNRKLSETNLQMRQRLKHTARGLRRESMRLQQALKVEEISAADAIVSPPAARVRASF